MIRHELRPKNYGVIKRQLVAGRHRARAIANQSATTFTYTFTPGDAEIYTPPNTNNLIGSYMNVEVIDSSAAKWRFTCPNNHVSWDVTNNHFYCKKCSQHHDVDPEFWELRDKKTGVSLSRDEVELHVQTSSPGPGPRPVSGDD